MKFLVILASIIISGCNSAPDAYKPAQAQAMDIRSYGDQHAVRVRLDIARNRVWVLGLDYVDVYDRKTRQLIRRIALPAWSVADFICEPDIAFDRSGTAFISHNLEPKLWQIDSDTFELKQHAIKLVKREHLDVGFSSLAFGLDGTLIGVASSGGSLWRIDLANAKAHEVATQAPPRECAFQ